MFLYVFVNIKMISYTPINGMQKFLLFNLTLSLLQYTTNDLRNFHEAQKTTFLVLLFEFLVLSNLHKLTML